jgi:hypothetical protein
MSVVAFAAMNPGEPLAQRLYEALRNAVKSAGFSLREVVKRFG